MYKNIKMLFNFDCISENIKKGFEWLKANDLHSLAEGKYEISNDDIYANVQIYETKFDAKYEAHRKYIDIQYVIKGVEKIGVTDINNCETCVEYDENKDLEFYNIKKQEEFVELSEGYFTVFFPQDAHKPSIACGEEKSIVKKVVVKIRI